MIANPGSQLRDGCRKGMGQEVVALGHVVEYDSVVLENERLLSTSSRFGFFYLQIRNSGETNARTCFFLASPATNYACCFALCFLTESRLRVRSNSSCCNNIGIVVLFYNKCL